MGRVTRDTRRVFASAEPAEATTTELSIVDASVARFAPCAAIWFFDESPEFDVDATGFHDKFEIALSETLNDYPHYVGQLQWAEPSANKPWRVGRLAITYGTPKDPGVEFVIVEDDRELKTLVPSHEERTGVQDIWNASDLVQNEFLPPTTLAFSSLTKWEGLPGVSAQLTTFKCGGFAVSLKLTHCLSDAICLMNFAQAWAYQSRRLFKPDAAGAEPPKAVFDPALLNSHAKLDIDGASPDTERINHARSLPMHRYDWWAEDAPGYPSWSTASNNVTKPSGEVLSKVQLSPSTHPPWPTWDLSLPVEHWQIRVSASAMASMKEEALKTLPEHLQSQKISRQDALLAHLWILVNRARQHQSLSDDVFMDMSMGMRSRLSPPLPDTYVGSPIFLMHVSKPGSEAASSTIGAVAGAIRQTMSRFTPDAVSDYLYDAAHEVSPTRLWQAFLGSRHLLVTSWARARAYELDFCGTRGLARYVQANMPLMDGLLQLMDVADTGDFDVSLALEKEAMRRFLRDPSLRRFEKP